MKRKSSFAFAFGSAAILSLAFAAPAEAGRIGNRQERQQQRIARRSLERLADRARDGAPRTPRGRPQSFGREDAERRCAHPRANGSASRRGRIASPAASTTRSTTPRRDRRQTHGRRPCPRSPSRPRLARGFFSARARVIQWRRAAARRSDARADGGRAAASDRRGGAAHRRPRRFASASALRGRRRRRRPRAVSRGAPARNGPAGGRAPRPPLRARSSRRASTPPGRATSPTFRAADFRSRRSRTSSPTPPTATSASSPRPPGSPSSSPTSCGGSATSRGFRPRPAGS